MGITAGMVASEVLMCALRQVPFIGPAVEVITGIQARHEALGRDEKLAAIERSLTNFERRMRDLAREEIEGVVAGLRASGVDGTAFSQHVRNFRAIREHGFQPSLFEGLLRNSPHWAELRRSPHHYGHVLPDGQTLDPEKIQIVVDADKARILELTPFAFAALLAQQQGAPAAPRMVCSQDVWAFVGPSKPGPAPRGEPPRPAPPTVAPQARPATADVRVRMRPISIVFDVSTVRLLLGDALLHEGSLKRGFDVVKSLPVGSHVLRLENRGLGITRAKDVTVSFPDVGTYELLVEFDRMWGTLSASVVKTL